MAQNLFPVFDVPEITTPAAAAERKYRPSVYFDFDLGDFRRDGAGNMVQADGREAYKQWCLKVCMTERFTCLSYTTDIGTEMIGVLSQADRAAVESALERTINEALMVNPKTEYVRNFTFSWENEDLHCTFDVKGQDWEEQTLTLTIPR
nr:DUF2634 domain-containing protein [uncultured Dysosmobacter sp.]